MVRSDTKTSEAMEMKGQNTDVSKDMMEDMCATGILAGGALPGFDAETEDGQKNLLAKITGEPVVVKKKAKNKARDTQEAAEALRPKSPLDQAKEKRSEVLRNSTKARELSLSLSDQSYGKDLCKELAKFSLVMEKLYKKMGSMIDQKINSGKAYSKIFQFVDERKAWFDKAQARGGSAASDTLSWMGETLQGLVQSVTLSQYGILRILLGGSWDLITT